MKVINVYEQYFAADCIFNTVKRRAVNVTLTATSDAGEVFYEVAVSFFPHTKPDDFAISYDAFASHEIYRAKGRRSKKRDEKFVAQIREEADKLAASLGGTIFWEKPLIEARRG